MLNTACGSLGPGIRGLLFTFTCPCTCPRDCAEASSASANTARQSFRNEVKSRRPSTCQLTSEPLLEILTPACRQCLGKGPGQRFGRPIVRRQPCSLSYLGRLNYTIVWVD